MKKLILLGLCIVYSFIIPAQTFISSSGGSIPDFGQPTYFPILVSGLSSSVLDSSFGVQSVCINILHNSDYQLTIELMAPDGTLINLSLYNGGTGNNYSNTCFTGTAANSITAGNPPFTGNYRPEGVLGNVNNGQNGNGTWRIKVQDHNAGVVGSLVSWRKTFSNTPAYTFIYAFCCGIITSKEGYSY